jgi:7-carboxy-7-deazaguanine synthase
MYLIELYKSLQGESSFAGLPCIFIRTAGCNLRCSWCDSEYTFTGGKKMSQEEVLAEVARLSPPRVGESSRADLVDNSVEYGHSALGGGLVEITGGEPMLQEKEIVPLTHELLARGYTVLIETSGERPLANVPKEVHKIVDVKCPGSGESAKFNLANLDALTSRDELKFVIASREDYEYARDFIARHHLDTRVANLLFSPAFRKDSFGTRTSDNCLVDPEHLANWILADKLNVRLGLQLHKFIWQPQIKGV